MLVVAFPQTTDLNSYDQEVLFSFGRRGGALFTSAFFLVEYWTPGCDALPARR